MLCNRICGSPHSSDLSLNSYLRWREIGLLQHFCKRNPLPESPNAGSPPHIFFTQGCSQPSWFATLRRLGRTTSRLLQHLNNTEPCSCANHCLVFQSLASRCRAGSKWLKGQHQSKDFRTRALVRVSSPTRGAGDGANHFTSNISASVVVGGSSCCLLLVNLVP